MTKSTVFYSMMYAAYVVLAVGLFYAITAALAAFLPDMYSTLFSSGSGSIGFGVVVLMVPPMMVATAFYKHEQRRMQGAESWILAIIFTLLFFVVLAAAVFLIGTFVPAAKGELGDLGILMNEGPGILATIVAVLVGLVFFVNKVFLWAGIRGEIKKAEKLAIKKARKG